MKLIPDVNSTNKYNNFLQIIVNTSVTLLVFSMAVAGLKVGYDVMFHDGAPISIEISSSDFDAPPPPPPPGPSSPTSFCYYSADIDHDYRLDRTDLSTASSYATNYRDLGNDAKGIVVTNEMLMAMSEEHNRLNASYDIGGFHLYFADKTTTGTNPSIVLVPIDNNHHELSPNEYSVLEVPEEVCGPCPLLCDEEGTPLYTLY